MLALVLAVLCGPAAAQELSALARLDPAASELRDDGAWVELRLAISQPVPWRVRVLDQPPRLVVDFREVDWTGLEEMPQASARVAGLRAGVFRPGWSRLVLDLKGPLAVEEAGMATGAEAQVTIRLGPTTAEAFAKAAALPEPPGWALPKAAALAPVAPRGEGPLVVVLDPGHGGLDPGAERDGFSEAALMLTFARELKELLLRDGGFAVTMTREEDVFVPLETRISLAHQAGAQVFLSLHADAIPEGEAVGATVYTLSEEASDKASQTLAERHNRDDLLAGVDLSGQDDQVAKVLMEMARAETTPRTERLAASLVAAIKGAGLKMHRHPHQEASFAVLKSADIPSVLLEVGFMSSQSDLDRLSDPEWRARLQAAILDGLKTWAEVEAAAP
ncbi:N-acetylmuramoyl-L-alanine amidase [Stagnihabitans tardus]|uniref:N-acetylmuramoyl-L-alanine amidase n=1 Tax=Stagnihabitans tardus TaxID=2699202 RepID=UPI00338E56DC